MAFVIRKKRARLLEIQNWRCCWCGEALELAEATLEHILPEIMGGTAANGNIAVAHKQCNEDRSDDIWRDPHPSFLFDFVRERLAHIRLRNSEPDGPLPKETRYPVMQWQWPTSK